MNEIIKAQPEQISTELAIIEYKIRQHINGAGMHLLGIGRCLNEAKASGLVPHGAWEGWVLKNTGLSLRQAQRYMEAAREVPEGSVMAQLPFTKIQACLQLPSGEERETMARRAIDEGMGLRELQSEVKRQRQATADALQRAERAERDQEETERRLRAELEQVQQTRLTEITPQAQAEIDRLRAEVADLEAENERQADLRHEAQQQLLNLKAQAARGESRPTGGSGVNPQELATAVRVFIGSAGVLPHMGLTLASASPSDKAQINAYVDMVAEWVDGARRALGTVFINSDEEGRA